MENNKDDLMQTIDRVLEKIKSDKVKFGRMGQLNAKLYKDIHDKIKVIASVKALCVSKIEVLEKSLSVITLDDEVRIRLVVQLSIYKEVLKLINNGGE